MSKCFTYYPWLIFVLLLSSCSQERKTNWRVSFDKNSKDPFGCYIAYHSLADFFPDAKIETGRNIMSEIKQSTIRKRALVNRNKISIVCCQNFLIDSNEFSLMKKYIAQGNTVCILAENLSPRLFEYMNAQYNPVSESSRTYNSRDEDMINNQNASIFFNDKYYSFKYNGLPIHYGFTLDSNFTGDYYYLAYSKSIDTPTIRLADIGDGTLILGRNPITMTNHFLLQNDNKRYLEYLYSFLAQYPSKVTWYSMYEQKASDSDENDLSWLLRFPPLFYAFLLLATLLLFYTLFESKRRQRIIPILPKNTNESLAFTETVGQLYYNKRDHKNLSEKMIQHYLETIRTKYGIKTTQLNETFIELLARKTNHTATDTHAFVAYIQYIRDADKITDIDIRHLYHQLQKFN